MMFIVVPVILALFYLVFKAAKEDLYDKPCEYCKCEKNPDRDEHS